MSVAIGIDLGTTNTVVAAVVDGVAVTLEDEQGRRLLPSVVSFHPSGTVLVGEPARERRLIDPENTIFSIKPLLGRTFESDEVKAAVGRFPFQLAGGAKNATMVMARDVAYALPEISAFVLRRAKAIAESALKQPVDRAVITVPANFNDLQRASTKIAGKLAGLDVMRILNEPTAAALAYGQSIAKAEKIAVYDLGGGTFDITLLDLTGNVFEVLATAGDTALGGDDIDRLIAERIALEIIKRFNFDPRSNPVALGRLRFLAEEMKKELSTKMTITRDVGGIGYTEGGVPIATSITMSREEIERIALPLVERTVQVAKQSIEIIGLHPKDFDRVILVGGSTRMPMVARMAETLFQQPPHLKVNPDEVVALGAAIQAHALNRSRSAKQPKRASAHDQLAKAQPTQSGERQASQPPTAPTVPTAADVPRAPPLPAGLKVTPQNTPQFFDLSKPNPVLTFSPPPEAPNEPPKEAKQGRSPPPVPKKGARPNLKPIEGTPARPAMNDSPSSGPKPARHSAAPPARIGPPPLAPKTNISGTYGSAAPPDAPADLQEVPDLEPVRSAPPDLGAIVSADFDEQPAPPPLELNHAAFARGSAIATADNAPLLIDVTPLSLRVETVGGYSDVLIAANTSVPCEKSRTFLTARDGQTVVFIRVAQGEGTKFAENTFLGELELSGLTAARRGEVKILVTFELDADGILNVRAKDKDTGRETKAQMKVSGASTDAGDVQAMLHRQARHVVA